MKMKPIETIYGLIYYRDALVISNQELDMYPFRFTVQASLSLALCKPETLGKPDVKITFTFTGIESLSIYKLDDYPYEKYTVSCFDEVDGSYKGNKKRIVLSTYDHVFDIVGQCDVAF